MINCNPIPHATTRHGLRRRLADIAPCQAKERDNPQETDQFECHNNGRKLLNRLIKRKPIDLLGAETHGWLDSGTLKMAIQNMGLGQYGMSARPPENRDVQYMKRGYAHDYSKTRLLP